MDWSESTSLYRAKKRAARGPRPQKSLEPEGARKPGKSPAQVK